MRRALLITMLACASVLAAAPVASAASGSFTDPSGDTFGGQPTGNSSGSLDIVRATFGHRGGRLVHKVTTAGDVGNPARGTNFPLLLIEHPTLPNGTAECTYFVGRHNGRLGVFACGYGTYLGSARITRTSARTVRFEFSPRAIENPPTYEWAFSTRSPTQYNAMVWADRIPSPDQEFFVHTLR